MDLAFYIFRLKFANLVNWKKNKSGLLFLLFLFLGSLLNSYFLIKIFETESIIPHREQILYYLFLLIFVFTLLRKFFPFYTKLYKLVLNHHPRSGIYRYSVNLSDDFTSFYFLNTLFFTALLLNSTVLSTNEGIKLILIIIAGIIVRRLFQVGLSQKFTNSFLNVVLVFVFVLMIIVGNLYYPFFTLTVKITDIFYLLLIFAFGCLYEERLTSRIIKENAASSMASQLLNLIFNQRLVRNSLLLGLLFKSFLLALMTFSFYKKGSYNLLFIVYLFSSPVILFTYAFNNTWGYYRNFWIVCDKATGSGLKLFWFHISLLKYPLLGDILITGIFLLCNKTIALHGLISYLTTLPLLITLSFYWSVYFPLYIGNDFGFKFNTSFLSSITTILIVLGLFPIFYSKWFFFLIPFYLLISTLLFKNINSFYSKNRISLYDSLFK